MVISQNHMGNIFISVFFHNWCPNVSLYRFHWVLPNQTWQKAYERIGLKEDRKVLEGEMWQTQGMVFELMKLSLPMGINAMSHCTDLR